MVVVDQDPIPVHDVIETALGLGVVHARGEFPTSTLPGRVRGHNADRPLEENESEVGR